MPHSWWLRTERAYLHAFNDLLYARTDDEMIAARAAMSQAFGSMLNQSGAEQPWLADRPKRDLVSRLVEYVQANRKTR